MHLICQPHGRVVDIKYCSWMEQIVQQSRLWNLAVDGNRNDGGGATCGLPRRLGRHRHGEYEIELILVDG